MRDDATDDDRPPRGRGRGARIAGGRAQLTLVEHALCPLDVSASLVRGLTHRAEFLYSDENRRRRTASAEVICPFGLSPADEFYLWGLLALSLSQPEPSVEFYATPHYCLSELGLIEAGQGGRGGKNYALFRRAIARLAAVTYVNDRFYDPVRGEHRSVAFGFLSYSLPIDPASSRAWRIVWDPIFFEFCQAARGSLLFDLGTYRSLDFASRRLLLLLKKIFHRNAESPGFDARHLGVHVLGFAPTIDVWNLKAKLAQCARRLDERGIIALPPGTSGTKGLFEKKGVGSYSIRFRRGPYFDRKAGAGTAGPARSALDGPLRSIGFDEAEVGRIIGRYKPGLVQVWADITLAAMEKSPDFFRVGPQAYFLDNVAKASRGGRTPPDWCPPPRKESRASRRWLRPGRPAEAVAPPDEARAFDEYLRGEAQAAFAEVVGRLRSLFESNGQGPREAGRNALESARVHMRHRFRKEHPEFDPAAPRAVGTTSRSPGEALSTGAGSPTALPSRPPRRTPGRNPPFCFPCLL